MRKRQQAPGELEQVREFVNTSDVMEGTDQLASTAGLTRWLSEQGLGSGSLRATRADLIHAVELREALRSILLEHNGEAPTHRSAHRTLDEAARRARLRLRFDERGQAVLEPESGGVDGALGRLLAIIQHSIAQGAWQRLKACREPSCAWAFYDHTKNRSGAWCTMQVCGNRAKARAYRARHA